MKAYSREFYEAQEFFERCVTRSEYGNFRLDKPTKEERTHLPAGEWYDHGETNKAFRLFLQGVEFGSRVAAQENSESPATIAQQRKAGSEDSAKICPKCDQGKYKYWNGSSWVLVTCELCGGTGKLLPC